MKSLWSKAGRVHRRGCRACSTLVHGAGRRVTAPRRRPTFAELFTAAYSSVFASAAIIDAVRKDERMKDLDRQLEDVRLELADLRAQNGGPPDELGPESLQSSISHLTDDQMDRLWRELKKNYWRRPQFEEIHTPATLGESALREKVQLELYRCPDEASMELLRRTNLERLEKAIILEESEAAVPRRDPRTQRQMERLNDSILRLVQQMMYRAKARPKDSLPSPSFDQAAKLLKDGFPRYSFRETDPGRAHVNTKLLNQANRAAIHNPDLGLKEKVGRVCYNLLISSYPPDMHTFNTLITAFDRHSGYRHFSESVIFTFFHMSKFLPTLCTYPAILHHYKVTANHGRFLRVMACITGWDAITGAKYKRRHIGELEGNVPLQRWALDTRKRSAAGEYVWEHAPLNRLMVEEILSGLLQFHMFHHAVQFFTACIGAGVYVSTRAVKQVLDECLVALDWKAAMRLIRQLVRRENLWSSILAGRDVETIAYLTDRIYSLLDMVGLGYLRRHRTGRRLANIRLSRRKLGVFLDEVSLWNKRLPDTLAASPMRGDGKDSPYRGSRSRLLQMESLDKELVRVRKAIKAYEIRFLDPDMPMEFRISMVMHISATAVDDAQRLGVEVSEALEKTGLTTPKDAEEKTAAANGTEMELGLETPGLISEVVAGQQSRKPPAAMGPPTKQRHQQKKQEQERPLRLRDYNDFVEAFAARRALV
ncbi:hypothetical protein ACRE_024060 [Hapsidospora chrysogenum ATCC 11550]|uniref:Uncharacterized protein n=1 Tax=Hapsidospora chrysogenum (strain ATCC 11550 / CBS 779.69 / DSM 880 / IAM 14645 / JCM 23072 / IMI 49137) TaxID=857340 RepID=A0A086TBP0_HAPC1|nr:hypothetical protein ACRE_024060 [Hapsidospora chrysogenum ATCC 11550]